MKIAVCISGELRLFDNPLILESYKKYINKYMPDVFISTWDHIGQSMNHQYIDPFDKKEKIKSIEHRIYENYNNVKSLKVDDYNNWINSIDEKSKNIAFNKIYSSKTINSYTQLYKIYDSIRLKYEYEFENNIKYDLVIRLRPDNLLISDLELESFEKNTIYHINIGEAYYPNRVYDMFFYGDSESMNEIASTYLNFETLVKYEYNNGLCPRDTCRLLYLQCIFSNIDIKSTKKRLCDIYRGGSFQEYYNLLKSWGGVS